MLNQDGGVIDDLIVCSHRRGYRRWVLRRDEQDLAWMNSQANVCSDRSRARRSRWKSLLQKTRAAKCRQRNA
jgi:glycine cleavage system aminomethyltransferase T